MDRDEEKLESYLRQFRARAPRPLELPEPASVEMPGRQRPWFLPAAAIAAVLLLALLFLFSGRLRQGPREAVQQGPPTRAGVARGGAEAEPKPEEISFVRLSRFAREEPDRLGRHLDELSARTLPDVRSGEGVLKRLARE